jgi:hypothetical protein
MEREDAEELRVAVLAAAGEQDADASEADEYGERYVLEFALRHEGRARDAPGLRSQNQRPAD